MTNNKKICFVRETNQDKSFFFLTVSIINNN